MSPGERVATVATLITAGVGLSLVIQPPLAWIFVAVLIVSVCLGTNQVLLGHPRTSSANPGLTVLVIPSLLTLGATLFFRLPALDRSTLVAVGLGLFGLILATALYAEYQTYDRSGRRYRQARNVLNLIAYVIAFALYSAIFAPKYRSLLSATAVLIATALICAELFRGAESPGSHRLWVGVVAFVMGQVTWALNYWVLGALTGGAILLLVFYTLTGVIRSHLNGSLAPRVFSEHLVVAGAGMAAVVIGGLWLR
jgi:hypothetical protein